jgi:ATP:corrinoid adenosyltransferase
MSRMIPPFYNEERTSFAEMKLFNALKRLPDHFTILHSMGLAEHKSKIFSEIDFVILSKQGILCLEVKGGRVFRENGVWHFVDRFGNENTKNESPFNQSVGAMLSLRNYLKKQFGSRDHIANTLFACGVVFPDIPFNQKGPDIIPEIVYDIRNNENELEDYIKGLYGYWRDKLDDTNQIQTTGLSDHHINKLLEFLRGDFGYVTSLEFILKRTRDDMLKLTKEQVNRLEMASENPRVLLTGGAGTGKTVISLEHAKRLAITGKKVLYLCFNKSLSEFIHYHNNVSEMGNLTITHFHEVLRQTVSRAGIPFEHHQKDDLYYTKTLPEAFCDLEGTGVIEQYDAVVVDEGQDLIRYEYLMCIDLMVKKGLKEGMWHICFDPFQNLYNKGLNDGLDFLAGTNHIKLKLDTNCRNTRPIGVYNTLLSGFPPPKRFKIDGLAPERHTYCDQDDLRRKLIQRVKNLIGQGVNPGSIYILSPRTYENSSLRGTNIFQGICKFQNVTSLKPGLLLNDSVKFSTVHSFKGLEADVVIYIDVEGFEDTSERIIHYTALSRAKSLLYIYYDEKAEDELMKMIAESTKNLALIEADS